MKLLKQLLIIIIIFPFIKISAQSFDEIIKNKNYIEILSLLNKNLNYKQLDNLNIYQIKKLAQITYKAYENNPIGIIRFIASENKKLDDEIMKDKSKIKSISVGMIQAKIWDVIKLNLSKKTYELIRTPYFIKAKIINKDTVNYIDKSTGFDYVKIVIKAVVIDVLKGKNVINKGSEIEFYYLTNWEKPKEEYKMENTYLLPLEPRNGSDLTFNLIALVTYLDTPDVVFEIKNGILLDTYNYFGLGNTNWDNFKKTFNEKIIKIKGGE